MLLKIGSTGDAVKTLQEYLKIKVDGVFGTLTEYVVKEWQAQNGLTPDGVVGKITWNAMAIANTDGQERPDYVLPQITELPTLNIIPTYMPKDQYFVGPTKKEWLFLHHTAGWQNPINTVNCWSRDDRGAIATEFVIGGQSIKGDDNSQDGIVAQAFPAGGYAWHLGTGRSAMHINSVGIECCNFGQIENGKTYVGVVAAQSQIVKLESPFRGHSTWHKYSDKQLHALRELIKYIEKRDSIDVRKGLPELIKTKGPTVAFNFCDVNYVSEHKGLWSHANVLKTKVDMFPQQELIDLLRSL